ncbi:26S proteasome subunit RPN7-domain-containing protein [Desarmillaria tabescens]|uniref:26S proteasome subunit RPN7-domain-containing protein n=1 Tax=Armillaria tabescens TaxID=1929756 RepID=A0AA39N7Q9_ARMTA|nr:26S proteasome subunit RPN7-domain-containing protein [Desarmillaria tabescens]KAK0460584.1 26S proteasome subunit RPN7-domain-containing protein [Desarmillaria tabescens]
MDIDVPEENTQASTSQPKRSFTVPVDDAHPFDLESYISNYSGRTAVDRLIHIIQLCPTIAVDAFHLAIQHIHQSRDPSQYQGLVTAYEQAHANANGSLPPISEFASLSTRWIDETLAKNQSDRLKLEMELKTYSNNMIKESIRMAHRDLGDFYRVIGEYATSLKHYTKSREYCTTSQHVLDMCLSVLELLIEQRNYGHLPTYVFKAEAALDAATAAASASANKDAPTPMVSTGAKKSSPERDRVQSKLDFATALSYLGQDNYEKASYNLLRLGSTKDLGEWIGRLVSPSDIAIYGTICAMASLSRSAFKARVLDNSSFGVYIEQEPYLRELIEAYMASKFQTVLDLLSRYSTRHYIDIHLTSHVHALMNAIKNRAVVLYFQPFSSIRLDRMSQAFGWSVDETEGQVVTLIQSGDIQGRVDSQNKILQVKQVDHRADLFARAIRAGNDMHSANRKLLLRMRLQQLDLVIKPPKGASSSHQSSMGEYIQVE